jgi:hypothetical protein
VETIFSQQKEIYTFQVRVGKKSLSAAGGQPLAFLFPKRIGGRITVISGQEFAPVITDDFLMLTKPKYEPGSSYKVEFRADL